MYAVNVYVLSSLLCIYWLYAVPDLKPQMNSNTQWFVKQPSPFVLYFLVADTH